MRKTFKVSLAEVIKKEKEFNESITPSQWKREAKTPQKGEYLTYLGRSYLVVNEVEASDNTYMPPRQCDFALNPFSAFRLICEETLQESVVIEISTGNQVWVYFDMEDEEQRKNNPIAYGGDTYAKPQIYGTGINVLMDAFHGILKHNELEMLPEV